MSRRSAGLATASDVAQLPNDAKLLREVLEEFIREKDAGWGRQCSWQGSVPTVDAIGQIAGDAAALKLAIVEILAAPTVPAPAQGGHVPPPVGAPSPAERPLREPD